VSGDFRTWFGEQVLDHDLTVTSLSHMLDVYDGTIEDWLAGRSVPSPAECMQLAELFEVPFQPLLRMAGHTT